MGEHGTAPRFLSVAQHLLLERQKQWKRTSGSKWDINQHDFKRQGKPETSVRPCKEIIRASDLILHCKALDNSGFSLGSARITERKK